MEHQSANRWGVSKLDVLPKPAQAQRLDCALLPLAVPD
jgi:hypothetical protein